MPDGRAFCLFWSVVPLPAADSRAHGVFGATPAQGQRELSRTLSGCQSVPVWGRGAETSARGEQEPGVRGRCLQSETSGAVALCHVLMRFPAINQVTWKTGAGFCGRVWQETFSSTLEKLGMSMGSTPLVPGVVACRFLRQRCQTPAVLWMEIPSICEVPRPGAVGCPLAGSVPSPQPPSRQGAALVLCPGAGTGEAAPMAPAGPTASGACVRTGG